MFSHKPCQILGKHNQRTSIKLSEKICFYSIEILIKKEIDLEFRNLKSFPTLLFKIKISPLEIFTYQL